MERLVGPWTTRLLAAALMLCTGAATAVVPVLDAICFHSDSEPGKAADLAQGWSAVEHNATDCLLILPASVAAGIPNCPASYFIPATASRDQSAVDFLVRLLDASTLLPPARAPPLS